MSIKSQISKKQNKKILYFLNKKNKKDLLFLIVQAKDAEGFSFHVAKVT